MRRLILVHGLGITGRYFEPLVGRLGDLECVVPDLRRHETLEAQAAALRELLEEPAALLGNSMGCQVIAELALREPGLVERAVFVGPTVDRRRRSALAQVWSLLVDAARERPSLVALAVRDYLATGPSRLWRTARSALADAIEGKLPAFGAPLLVVSGEHDPLCPEEWSSEVAQLAPRGRLVVVAGAAHAVHYSHPEELARLVRVFLEEPA